MSWARLDDKFHSHRKVMKLGPRPLDRLTAIGLWTLCLSYGVNHPSDGRIDRDVVIHFTGSEELAEKLAARLVACGLWERADGGAWVYHDWADYEMTVAELEAERLRRAESGRLGGRAKARSIAERAAKNREQVDGAQANTENQGAPSSESLAGASRTPGRSVASIPSRPDPTRPDQEEEGSPAMPVNAGGSFLEMQAAMPKSAKVRMTRCPKASDPGAEEWCRVRGIPPPAVDEVANFLTWHSGKGNRWADWQQAWSLWVKRRDDHANGDAKPWSVNPQQPQGDRLWTPGEEANRGERAGSIDTE